MRNFTKPERLAIAEAFKDAKKRLWKGTTNRCGKERYICYALNKGPIAGIRAKDIVLDRLAPHCSVEAYLGAINSIPRNQLTTKNLQTFRHLWLDKLIEEFSE